MPPSKEDPPPKDDNTQGKTRPPKVEIDKNESNFSANSSLRGVYVFAAIAVCALVAYILFR